MLCSTTNRNTKPCADESGQRRSGNVPNHFHFHFFIWERERNRECSVGKAKLDIQDVGNEIIPTETCRYRSGTDNKNQEHIVITSSTQLKIMDTNDSSMKIQMQMIYESHSQPFLLPLKSQCMSFYSIV